MRAMILAAGRGQRLRPLTDHTPKALIEVGGKPLLQWHLENLRKAGFREVVINTAHLGEKIRDFGGNGRDWGLNIHYSEESSALETGGGIFKALPLLGDGLFLVINADIWTDYPLYKLRSHHCSHAHLVMVDNPPDHPVGDFVLRGGLLATRHTQLMALTFSGLGVYHPRLFRDCQPGRFSLTPLLKTAMAKSQLSGEHYRGRWFDCGTAERLEILRASLDGA